MSCDSCTAEYICLLIPFFSFWKKMSLWYILVEEWESMILFCFFCLMWFSKREIICRPHWGRVVIKPSTMLCKLPVIYDLCYRRDTHRSKIKLFLLVVKRQSPNPKLENGNDELHYDRYPHFHPWQQCSWRLIIEEVPTSSLGSS